MGLPRLICADPARVAELWPNIKERVASAVKRGGLGRFENLERDILSGDALVWLALSDEIEAVAVTQTVITDDGNVCLIQACGGKDFSRWIGLIDGIEQYAKAEGCVKTRITGRRGWLRVLKNYRETKVILERPL